MTKVDYFSLATPGVQALHPYQPGKPLAELEREYGIRHAVKLASNENPLGPSPAALQAVREQLNDLARYPDGNGFAVKAALAKKHGVDAEQGLDLLGLGAFGFLFLDGGRRTGRCGARTGDQPLARVARGEAQQAQERRGEQQLQHEHRARGAHTLKEVDEAHERGRSGEADDDAQCRPDRSGCGEPHG